MASDLMVIGLKRHLIGQEDRANYEDYSWSRVRQKEIKFCIAFDTQLEVVLIATLLTV